MQDKLLLTVCTKNEYNILLTVGTKTKAEFPKTDFFYSRWILEFFQLKITFLLTVCTNLFVTKVISTTHGGHKTFSTNAG